MSNRFSHLPPEIKEDILDHIIGPIRASRDYSPALADLSRLSCIDRQWRRRCLPHLYAQIRLPRVHTPPNSEKHLLFAARDAPAILLARTLRQNEKLAHLVKDIEINPSWLPEDGMERAREAYIDILNRATQTISIAFYVSRGEYNEVLSSVKTVHPLLTTLIIGVDTLHRDIFLPLLAKQRNATFAIGSSESPRPLTSRIDPGPTPQIRIRSFYLAPALRELQIYLPSRLELDFTVAATIRAALPPQVQHLHIFVGLRLADHGVWSTELNHDHTQSTTARPLASFFGPYMLGKAEAILKLASTEFILAADPNPAIEPSTVEQSSPARIEHRLQSLTLHFADRITRGSSARLQILIDMLRSSKELRPFFPLPPSSDSEDEEIDASSAVPCSSVRLAITSFPRVREGVAESHINSQGYTRGVEDTTFFRLALAEPERGERLEKALRLRGGEAEGADAL